MTTAPSAGRVSFFTFPATCPQCAHDLELVNSTTSWLLAEAILECPACEKQYELTTRIRAHASQAKHLARRR